MNPSRTARILITLGLIAVCLPPPPARAAYPGSNGLIVYAQELANEETDLCVVHPDGRATSLDSGPGTDWWPQWSPDGRQLAFTKWDSQGTNVVVMDLAGGAITSLGPGDQPTWSPDGTQILLRDAEGLWVMDADGADRHLVLEGNARDAEWSPDGSTIMFVDDLRDNTYDDGGIYLMDADGSNLRRFGGGYNPAWSPDSSTIAYESSYFAQTISLAPVTEQGQEAIDITAGLEPEWSPDGSKIVFTDEGAIWTVNPDGSERTYLVQGPLERNSYPDWQPLPEDGAAPSLPQSPPCGTFGKERRVSLRVQGHLRAAGKLTGVDGIPRRCIAHVRVEIWRVSRRHMELAGTTRTAEDGTFRVRIKDRPGRYQASVQDNLKLSCSAATSGRRNHRH